MANFGKISKNLAVFRGFSSPCFNAVPRLSGDSKREGRTHPLAQD